MAMVQLAVTADKELNIKEAEVRSHHVGRQHITGTNTPTHTLSPAYYCSGKIAPQTSAMASLDIPLASQGCSGTAMLTNFFPPALGPGCA